MKINADIQVMKYWKKISHKEQDKIITAALNKNINYEHFTPLGIPVSQLDPYVFYDKASFLKEAPLLRTYIQNPNHIGCHTLGESEPFFEGVKNKFLFDIIYLNFDIFIRLIFSKSSKIGVTNLDGNATNSS